MGNKINAYALRLGVNKGWNSIVYTDNANFSKVVGQDVKIREMVKKSLNPSGLDKIVINRLTSNIVVDVYVARPGVAIGRGGEGIDKLQKDLKKLSGIPVEIKINEVKKPDLSARIIARSIADGIERRQPPKILMSSFKQKAIAAGAKGIKIWIGGRIGGNSQARTIKDSFGAVPLQTLRANIDYAEERANTTDSGILGVKVWVYNVD